MAKSIPASETIYLQRVCKICGFYDGQVDGHWTSELANAEEELNRARKSIRDQLGAFDTRSERNIATLIPSAQRLAREFLIAANDTGLNIRIVSGSRTYAEQDALFARGRTIPNTKIVTNAKGGESNHNFGLAWDIGIFDASGRYMNGDLKEDHDAYETVGQYTTARLDNLEWGGDWTSFKDLPHYQLNVGKLNIKDVRSRFENGTLLTVS